MNRKWTSFVLLLVMTVSYSQKQFLDYAVTNGNDTIYGVFRNVPSSRATLLQINPNALNPAGKLQSVSLKNVKTIRLNDEIYQYSKITISDGIYDEPIKTEENSNEFVTKRKGDFVNIKPRLQDYVVNRNTNDTVYGTITSTVLGSRNLIDRNGNKTKIDYDVISAYRIENDIYHFREKQAVHALDSKKHALKLLLNGKVKLYQYDFSSYARGIQDQYSTTYYYIEKDNKFTIINASSRDSKQKQQLGELFADNINLASLINNEVYDMDNIYLIVKYYNNQ